MHHIARHFVACFLTRGGCGVHWEVGEAAFERLLVDFDWSINATNWLWLSGLFFFFTFHRVYDPVAFGKKHDRGGTFVRLWVPELRDLPDRFVFQPWAAPVEVQQRAGCIVGRDYPAPVFTDFGARSKDQLGAVERAYLAAPPAFLAWIPEHALRELERENPSFGHELRAKCSSARRGLEGGRPWLPALRCDTLGMQRPSARVADLVAGAGRPASVRRVQMDVDAGACGPSESYRPLRGGTARGRRWRSRAGAA